MKTKIIHLIVFFAIILGNHSYSQSDSAHKRIFVAYTSFRIFTNTPVGCSKFEANFAGRIKSREISNVDTIQQLEFYLKNAKYKRGFQEIDAREKIIFEKSDGFIVSICVSQFDVMIDGRIVKNNKKMLQFLKQLSFSK